MLALISEDARQTIAPALGQALVVGRSPTADVRIDHPTLARLHLRVVRDERGLVVEDLGSPSGTYVNGQCARGPTQVAAGDRVRIGGIVLIAAEPKPAADP